MLTATLRQAAGTHWARCLLAAAILAHLFMMGSLFWGYLDAFFDNSHSLPKGVDFFSVYEAGHSILENRSVYHFDAGDTSATPYHNPYRYLPMFAYAVAVPFNAIPAWWAYWGWVSFYELLLVFNAYATWRIAGRGAWGLVAAAMWFVFTPFYVEQYMGQFSFLMATSFFFIGVGLVRRRELLAGLPWVASLVTKSNSALLLPVFLRLGWWRPIAMGATLVALNAAYYATRPRDLSYFLWINLNQVVNEAGLGFFQYKPQPGELRFFENLDQRFLQFSSGEHGALALFRNSYLAFDSAATSLPGPFALALAVVVIGVGVGATFFSRKDDILAVYGIWISTFFLLYTVWEHHYVMYLPVLVLLVALRPASRPVALITFAFVALPSPYWLINNVWTDAMLPPPGSLATIQESWPAWAVVVHHAAKPVPVFVLWAYLVRSQFQRGPSDADGPDLALPTRLPES